MAQGASYPRLETIDMNTGLLSYYQPKVSLGWNHFEERQIPKQDEHSFKKNISISKMHWLARGLRKVKVRWNQVSS